MKRVICVVGPTASGKTALAVNLALALDGEVVSVDSMQLYEGMNVGTAKPTEEEMRGVPHHMLSVCPPTEAFSAGKYVEMAAPIVDEILARGKTVILAGGTGLYIDSLISGREFAPHPEDGYRAELEALDTAALRAAGGLLQYLYETQKTDLGHIANFNYHNSTRYVPRVPRTKVGQHPQWCYQNQ